MHAPWLLLPTLMLIFGLSCKKASREQELLRAPMAKAVEVEEADRSPSPAPAPGASASPQTTAQTQPPALRSLKLIRTGEMELEIKAFDTTVKELGRLARDMGGYVADSQATRHPQGYQSGSVVIRIPAERFEAAGEAFRKLGKVLNEKNNVQDVTREYADLEIRIRVKREAESRLRELLRTKAGSLKEVLELEREITRVVEEIERMEGSRRFYDHQISLSTLTLRLSEPAPLSTFQPSSWSSITEVFRDGTRWFATSLAILLGMLIVTVPWIAFLWLLIWGIRRIWRRHKSARCPSSQVASNTEKREPNRDE